MPPAESGEGVSQDLGRAQGRVQSQWTTQHSTTCEAWYAMEMMYAPSESGGRVRTWEGRGHQGRWFHYVMQPHWTTHCCTDHSCTTHHSTTPCCLASPRLLEGPVPHGQVNEALPLIRRADTLPLAREYCSVPEGVDDLAHFIGAHEVVPEQGPLALQLLDEPLDPLVLAPRLCMTPGPGRW